LPANTPGRYFEFSLIPVPGLHNSVAEDFAREIEIPQVALQRAPDLKE
jgi:hypothetical protein